MNPSSDSNLFELVQSGNHLAFTSIIDKYWEDLYRHIVSKIKNSEDAKDMVQEIFLSLWKNRSNIAIEENNSLAPYLYKSAKYTVINYFTRLRITIADEELLSAALNEPSDAKTDDLLLVNELQNFLKNEVDQLPERLQLPYRLSREQDLPIREIAKKLSLSEQTVKNNISAALSAIRLKLRKYNAEETIIQILFFAHLLHRK